MSRGGGGGGGGLRRISGALVLCVYKSSSTFFKHLIIPFLKNVFSKTLDLFSPSMDHFLLPEYDDVSDSLSLHKFDRSEIESEAESLYFVPFRWWNEAREALCADITGVMYATTSSVKRVGRSTGDSDWDIELEEPQTEIYLNMRKQDHVANSECEEGFSGRDFSLVSEWMFLKAVKRYSDLKAVGSFLASEDNTEDLFPLQIRLSFLWETNSLVVRINQKFVMVILDNSFQLTLWDLVSTYLSTDSLRK